jgi:hypothetical protein
MTARTIHKAPGQQHDVADLLQTIFALELAAPSGGLWLVSPWISDIPVIDNRAGDFATVLDPAWGDRWITLSEVLARLVTLGTHVVLGVRWEHEFTDAFVSRTEELARLGTADRLTVIRREDLHHKGLLTDRCHLGGSMNFTFNGIALLQETIRYTTDGAELADLRIEYNANWGGTLPGMA